MQILEVGGAVRDRLMDLDPQDHDWVVIGATPEDMLQKGFRPVGADFPVFLHPKTKEEYALARTERKTAPGYSGFQCYSSPDVTLDEDLGRRDLTINAMAQDLHGVLFDPYGGVQDLQNKVLRHVSAAFSEDPLRILRVARFLARFGPEWHIAPETLQLLREMVAAGAVDELVPERVWKETVRALQEPHPALYLQCLDSLGVWTRLAPGLNRPATSLTPLTTAALANAPVTVRFVLAFPDSNPLEAKASSEFASLMESLQKLIAAETTYASAPASARLDVLLQAGALRKAETFNQAVDALSFRLKHDQQALVAQLRRDADQVRAVPLKDITASMPPGRAVGEAIRTAQQLAIA